jgi:hypothetical protein
VNLQTVSEIFAQPYVMRFAMLFIGVVVWALIELRRHRTGSRLHAEAAPLREFLRRRAEELEQAGKVQAAKANYFEGAWKQDAEHHAPSEQTNRVRAFEAECKGHACFGAAAALDAVLNLPTGAAMISQIAKYAIEFEQSAAQEAPGSKDAVISSTVSAALEAVLADPAVSPNQPTRNLQDHLGRTGSMVRVIKVSLAVLCFGIGAAFAMGAVNALVHPDFNANPFDVAFPGMFAAMFLLGTYLLLRRKA